MKFKLRLKDKQQLEKWRGLTPSKLTTQFPWKGPVRFVRGMEKVSATEAKEAEEEASGTEQVIEGSGTLTDFLQLGQQVLRGEMNKFGESEDI